MKKEEQSKLNARERFVAALLFKQVDRVPFTEWCGYWDETLLRWHCEGLPIGTSIEDYFGFDSGLRPPYPTVPNGIPIDMLLVPRFVERTLEENDRYRLLVDNIGIKKRILKSSSSPLGRMPQHIEWPVRNREDFQKLKERFNPDDPRRIGVQWSEELVEYCNTQTEMPIGVHIPGFFGTGRELMGMERLLISFHKDPVLISEMFEFWIDFLMKMIRKALPFKIDYAEIWEDMAYRNGPHISPKLFREFIFPHYKTFIKFLKTNGVRLFILDSDGDLRPLIPLLVEAGVNCIYPMEVQSGMDARALRKQHGQSLAMIGNIDKRALIAGKTAIRKEVKAKFPSTDEGGYIPSADHLVPPDVSFSNYEYYVNLLKQHLLGRR